MAIAMTVIELIAGEIFIVKMHVKLWDYTGNKFNYKGIICPLYSLIWAALGAVYYFFIHPYILDALNWLANNLAFSFFIGFFYGVFAIDLFYSLKLAEKIKTFAEENDMVIRYEEFKRHIRESSEERKEKYRFMLSMGSGARLGEHLKSIVTNSVRSNVGTGSMTLYQNKKVGYMKINKITIDKTSAW